MTKSSPVSLITGGSSGIGAATARRLLADGHRVTVTGRNAERLERFAAGADAGDRLLTVAGSAEDNAAVTEAVEATVSAYGRLDHVVANAGFATSGSIADGDPDEWREMVLANVLGPALLIRASLPQLRRNQGRIVLIGSVAGVKYTAGNLYGATKWAVNAIAENTRMLVTDDGVGVSLIAPGKVDTAFWEDLGGTPPGQILSDDRLAECVSWVLNQPAGTDVNSIVIRPQGQQV